MLLQDVQRQVWKSIGLLAHVFEKMRNSDDNPENRQRIPSRLLHMLRLIHFFETVHRAASKVLQVPKTRNSQLGIMLRSRGKVVACVVYFLGLLTNPQLPAGTTTAVPLAIDP